jgi:hypothetical protein
MTEVEAPYRLEGTLIEACNCKVLCPCWIGEDPDEGECWAIEAYHIARGIIAGVDVSGLTYVQVEHIPGNVLVEGSWRQLRVLDAAGTDEQRDVLLRAFRGEFGGPLADLAALVGTEAGVDIARISHEVVEGKGVLRIEDSVEVEMEPFRGNDGTITTLRDSLFSSVPGSPAWVSKAGRNRVAFAAYGFVWDHEGRNAIQAEWKLEHTP